MPAPRRFDHDEARTLRGQGLSYQAIADRVGVTPSAVIYAVSDEARRRQRAYAKSWAGRRSSPCIDCGAPTSYRSPPAQRCLTCHRLHYAPSVRETQLRCYLCREWKPDDSFHQAKDTSPLRRGRNGVCKACGVIQRKALRHQKTQPCADCGAPTMGKTGRCLTCANRRKGNGRKRAETSSVEREAMHALTGRP